MKKENTLIELLKSLQPYPSMRFLLFCNSLSNLENRLIDYCDSRDYEVQIYDMSGKGLEVDKEFVKVREFKATQPRYNLQGKLYDYCFIHSLPPNIEEFLKRIYSAIANAGRIYIELDIKDKESIYSISSMLQESNFVSISKIELDENRVYISGKKMHGWGS